MPSHYFCNPNSRIDYAIVATAEALIMIAVLLHLPEDVSKIAAGQNCYALWEANKQLPARCGKR